MTEEQFLEKYVFYGLTDLNDGYDSPTIRHFTADEFMLAMERAEDLGVTILGIECWDKQTFGEVRFIEDYEGNQFWHRKAFVELRKNSGDCTYSATFEVPDILLE